MQNKRLAELGTIIHDSVLFWVELVNVKYMEGARKVCKLSDSQYYRNFNKSVHFFYNSRVINIPHYTT